VSETTVHFRLTPESLRNLERGPEVFREEIIVSMGNIARHIQTQVRMIIQRDDIIFTRFLFNSIDQWVETAGSIITALVGSAAEYAPYQEFGTTPHFVPFNVAPSLYDEARVKWEWTVPKGQSMYQEDNKGRMWLVPPGGGKPAWGLMVTGQKQPFLWPGFQESLEFAELQLREACRRASARLEVV
jgi:hypothetical protein